MRKVDEQVAQRLKGLRERPLHLPAFLVCGLVILLSDDQRAHHAQVILCTSIVPVLRRAGPPLCRLAVPQCQILPCISSSRCFRLKSRHTSLRKNMRAGHERTKSSDEITAGAPNYPYYSFFERSKTAK